MDTTFISKVTVVATEWLQQVNDFVFGKKVLADLYPGVDPTGAVECSAAFNACLAANAGKTVTFSGTPLINSSIIIPTATRLISNTSLADTGNGYFVKASGMTTPGVIVKDRASFENAGVHCPVGTSGGGVQAVGLKVLVRRNVIFGDSSLNPTGVGIRVGSDTAAINCNISRVEDNFIVSMGSHGVYLHDGFNATDTGDVNALTLESNAVLGCGGDAYRVGNAYNTHVINNDAEGCTGYGLRITSQSKYTKIDGGDYETNIAGNVKIEYGAIYVKFSNWNPAFTISDDQVFRTMQSPILDWRMTSEWFPVLTGDTTTLKTCTAIIRVGTTVTFTIPGHTFIAGDTFAISGTAQTNPRMFSVVDDPSFDGGYTVAGVIDPNTITATLSARQAAVMRTQAWVGTANARVGYKTTGDNTGVWSIANGVCSVNATVQNANVAANALISGNLIIAGLPFAAATQVVSAKAAALFQVATWDGVTWPAGVLNIFGTGSKDQQYIQVQGAKSAASSVLIARSQTAYISVQGTYYVSPV